jgi:hypothetical protein
MHPLIKSLYDQSYKNEDGAKAWHDVVFDIEAFAQRIVFRCAVAAKIAQANGKDAYTEIMEKYGSEITMVPQTNVVDGEPKNDLSESDNELV